LLGFVLAVAAVIIGIMTLGGKDYPRHDRIVATVFWVGEAANAQNAGIPNFASAWDSNWLEHYGGVDEWMNRDYDGLWPATFEPKENPFYFALPYYEYNPDGSVKANANRVYWYDPARPPTPGYSILKNRWVKITHGEAVAYAQWQDVGPIETDDIEYVFGEAGPKNQWDTKAGIDISPAVANYLGISGKGDVSWQFVDEEEVPKDGPWYRVVTTSQVSH
jgi:hypothetical protein